MGWAKGVALGIVAIGFLGATAVVMDPVGWFNEESEDVTNDDVAIGEPTTSASAGPTRSASPGDAAEPVATSGVDFEDIDAMGAAISQSGLFCEQFHVLQPGESAPDSDAGAVDDPGLVEWGQCFMEGEIMTLKVFESPEYLQDYMERREAQIAEFDPNFYLTILHSEDQSWMLEVNYRPYILERLIKALDATEETCLGGC